MYGYDDQGRVVGELGAADGVRWTVHVANKAAWYGYSNAMDGGDNAPGIPGALRNTDIEPARREEVLVINAGPVRIDGVSKNADGSDASYRMAGQFWKKLPVTLGHLRTDDAGRLLVFPADGVSNSALPQNPVRDFTNNDGWHDDACGDLWGKGPYPPRTVLEVRKLDQDDIAEVDATFYAPIKKKRVRHNAVKSDINED